jgi:hypothetical protein
MRRVLHTTCTSGLGIRRAKTKRGPLHTSWSNSTIVGLSLSLLTDQRLNTNLDLQGEPTQYREVQGFESARFLSYFPRFTSLEGGAATGFHHVTAPPPDKTRRLYRISGDVARLVVRQVPPEKESLVEGDAYILDAGKAVWQLNTTGASGKEKFKAAEVAHSLADARKGACTVEVFGSHLFRLAGRGCSDERG